MQDLMKKKIFRCFFEIVLLQSLTGLKEGHGHHYMYMPNQIHGGA
jgi:hypothetical protein